MWEREEGRVEGEREKGGRGKEWGNKRDREMGKGGILNFRLCFLFFFFRVLIRKVSKFTQEI